jgi:MFS family permease
MTHARWSTLWRALRHRNFRLFFFGQGFSLIGTWMQGTATSWMVYRMTDSPLLLGLTGFSGQISACLFAPLAGVMADRWDRRKMLLITQSLAMLQAFVLFALAAAGVIAVWQILLLNFLLGTINAFDIPGRQSFLLDMLENKADLGNAIALQSSLFNSTRLIGPSVAGILIASFGEKICFLVNGLSYSTVLLALAAMTIHRKISTHSGAPILTQLKEGFSYTFGFFPIRALLIFLALVSLMGSPFTVLMPVFAKDILRGDARLLGFMMAAVGLGALAGAIFLASRRTVLGFGRLILAASSVFALGILAFSRAATPGLSLTFLFVAGFGMMLHMAASNTIIQTIADDDKRGRVMSFYTLSIMGTAPFGSILAGALAARIGAQNAVMLGGFVCLGGSALFAGVLPRIREQIRPIYRKKGIIKEVARGIQSATEIGVPPEE